MSKEIYTEKVTATVNEENTADFQHHEVILKCARTGAAFVLRNAPGARAVKDGLTYELIVREPHSKAAAAKNKKILTTKTGLPKAQAKAAAKVADAVESTHTSE